MSFKKTLIFLAILLALGGYYYVVEVKMAAKKQAAETADKRLFTVKKEEIATLALKRTDGEIVLKKGEKGWQLEQPVAAATDAAEVDRLLTDFADAQRDKTIADKADNLEEFGLNAPEFVLTATTAANASFVLSIGKETPTMSGFYAKTENAPAVVSIDNLTQANLSKTAFDLRDKTILAFDPAQVKKAAFTLPANAAAPAATVELAQQDAVWSIAAPQQFSADTEKVNAILSQIKSARIQEFVSETPTNLAEYGLDAPQKSLALTIGDEPTPQTLLIGKRNDEKGGVYAQYAATGNVFLIPSTIDDEFPKALNDLRDKALVRFENTDIQKIEIKTLAETVTLQREAADAWKIVAQAEFPANADKVNVLLNDAKNAKAAEFVDAATDPMLFGFDRPNVMVSLWKNMEESPLQLVVGNPNIDNTGLYVKTGEVVTLADPTILSQLRQSAFALRNKTIAPFKADDVASFEITYQESSLVVEKSGENWKAEQETLQAFEVNNLLYDLAALEFVEEPIASAPDLSLYGLNTPAATVTLRNAKHEELVTFLFGKQAEKLFVKTAAADAIYPINAAFLDELPKQATDLAQ